MVLNDSIATLVGEPSAPENDATVPRAATGKLPVLPETVSLMFDVLAVPIPTFPPFVTIKLVAVDEPITKDGPVIPFGFTDSCAHGVDEARASLVVKLFVFENVLKSASSVDDAAVPDDVSTQTKPADVVFNVPTVDVDNVKNPARRLVVDAFMNDE